MGDDGQQGAADRWQDRQYAQRYLPTKIEQARGEIKRFSFARSGNTQNLQHGRR